MPRHAFMEDACRIAGDRAMLWEKFRHDSSCTNNAAFADVRARQKCRSHANPNVIACSDGLAIQQILFRFLIKKSMPPAHDIHMVRKHVVFPEMNFTANNRKVEMMLDRRALAKRHRALAFQKDIAAKLQACVCPYIQTRTCICNQACLITDHGSFSDVNP